MSVERHCLELGENTDAAEDHGRFRARGGDRAELPLAGEKHTGCAPAAAERGREGDVAYVIHDGGRPLAEARDQLAHLVGDRVPGDRNTPPDRPVGPGEEDPFLGSTPLDGGVECRFAPVIGR